MSNIKLIFDENSNFKLCLSDNFQIENEEKKGDQEDKDNIGNSKNDFLPLKKLYNENDENGDCRTILKVKSKKNNKIYIMKIFNKNENHSFFKM